VKRKLTIKQQRYVDFYDGNATDAARKAGYKHPKSQGQRLLTNVDIQTAIKAREKKRNKKTIATREERQEFWSKTMSNTEKKTGDRLRASELLGRSEGDFIDRTKHEGDTGLTVKVVNYADRLQNALEQKRKAIKSL
jgi:phage terminase small subunit